MSLRPTLTDTPVKSATPVSLTRNKSPMEDVKRDVERDIKNTLFTTDTNEFLNKRIPLIPTIDESLRRLTTLRIYDRSRWVGFPQIAPSSEKPLYTPFVTILKAIVHTMSLEHIRTNILYIDPHNRTPLSLEANMASGRPDGVGAQPDANLEEIERKMHLEVEKVKSQGERGIARIDRAIKQCAKDTEELLGLYRLWWMCIHIVYEVKVKKSEEELFSAVKQLLGYMRQVLTEQLDRRFVLGFVLLFDELTLVSCDRSGVTMTRTPINIHTEPEKLIRIITGFSHMNPVQLGWDTAMKIYRPLSDDAMPSYKIANKFEGIHGRGRYNIHWVIDVEKDDKVESYVAVGIISAIRSAEICGRATVVYEVVKFDEREDPKETYALKRYWRPIRADSNDPDLYPSEGQIYDILDDGQTDNMKHAIVYHDVKINGEVDSTLKLIRCGQDAQPYRRRVKRRPDIRSETDADAELRAERREVLEESFNAYPDPSNLVLVERYHTNILMPMGEVIKALSCHLELLICFQCFVKEQKYAHNKYILHRDISTGNLLIFEADDGSFFGRIMDYDHAKKASGMGKIESNIAGLPLSELEYQRDVVRLSLRYKVKNQVEDNVFDVALKWAGFDGAAPYIKDVATLFGLSNSASKRALCLADFRWSNTDAAKPHDWPDFGNREPGPGERTGTVPYMSAEVISRESLFPLPVQSMIFPPFMHQAIHDVESLLWVLVRLCLTRKGPGINMRREELDEHSPKHDRELEKAIVRLFEGSDAEVEKTKTKLIRNPNQFEETVIAYFHPYFEPFKPFVRRWWATLHLGYKYRGEEFYNIHDHILRILEEAIAEISKDKTEDEEAKQAELDRRRKDKERRLATFRDLATRRLQNSTTPPAA